MEPILFLQFKKFEYAEFLQQINFWIDRHHFDDQRPNDGVTQEPKRMSSTEPSDLLKSSGGGSGPRLPLPFQQLLLHAALTTDALLILARGLGLLSIVSHLLYVYDNPEVVTLDADKVYKNFVVMIGAEAREETLIGQNMAELVTTHQGTGAGLQVVNTDKVGVDQRYRVSGTCLY
jgi:hypothetical protein